MSRGDIQKRRRAKEEQAMKLKNPNFFISKTRLQVRNVPIDTDQKELKRIFHDAVKRRATQANPRRGCVSTPTSTWVCSHHPPRRHSYTSRRPPPQPPAAGRRRRLRLVHSRTVSKAAPLTTNVAPCRQSHRVSSQRPVYKTPRVQHVSTTCMHVPHQVKAAPTAYVERRMNE